MAANFDQAAYTAAYNKANYARIELKIPKDVKARWELQAKAAGMSLTAWISEKANEQITGWSYILMKGDFDEALTESTDYHFRVYGSESPSKMVEAIKRIGADDSQFYIEGEDDADTISNFLSRFDK